jgi:hypothetical protein
MLLSGRFADDDMIDVAVVSYIPTTKDCTTLYRYRPKAPDMGIIRVIYYLALLMVGFATGSAIAAVGFQIKRMYPQIPDFAEFLAAIPILLIMLKSYRKFVLPSVCGFIASRQFKQLYGQAISFRIEPDRLAVDQGTDGRWLSFNSVEAIHALSDGFLFKSRALAVFVAFHGFTDPEHKRAFLRQSLGKLTEDARRRSVTEAEFERSLVG